MQGQRNNFRKIILIFFSGIIFSIIVLELGLRFFGFIFLSLQEYKNRSAMYKKGVFSIMCIGESMTVVGGNDAYSNQLERILNKGNIGVRFSVINKGVVATDSFGLLRQLEANLNQYRPDIVIAMMGVNDEGVQYYKEIPEANTPLFNNFRTYKLFRMILSNLASREQDKTSNYPPEVTPPPISLKAALVEDRQKSNPQVNESYFNLGLSYKELGNYALAEEMFRKAIALEPQNDECYFELGWVYKFQGKLLQSEEAFNKAIRINPSNIRPYIELGCSYVDTKNYVQAEEMFKKAADLEPENERVFIEFGRLYQEKSDFAKAEESFRKAVKINSLNERALAGLISIYRAEAKLDGVFEYENKLDALRQKYYNPVTKHNYQRLKTILDKRGIRLACMQYPMRSIEPLKKMFKNQTDILFLDNEKIFKDAIAKEGCKEYFEDMFAGDFGHCTPKGNGLLAENIGNTILKEVFHK